MKRFLTTLVILTGLLGSAGAVWADAQSEAVKGLKAYQAGDYAEAMKWWRKAAEQGLAGAQNNLGLMYDKGTGVLQDTIAAHMWFNIAAANGNTKAAGDRDVAAGKLSSSGVEEAQKRAKRCMASDYKDCD
jgi:TPR repeat protein